MARTETELLEAIVLRGLRPQRWSRGPWTVAVQDRLIVDPVTLDPVSHEDWRTALELALDAEEAK